MKTYGFCSKIGKECTYSHFCDTCPYIRLAQIERIAREAFSDPETQDINLYRAQALAKIFQIFEYDGATLKKDEEV